MSLTMVAEGKSRKGVIVESMARPYAVPGKTGAQFYHMRQTYRHLSVTACSSSRDAESLEKVKNRLGFRVAALRVNSLVSFAQPALAPLP